MVAKVKRFSKAAAIEHIRDRAEIIQNGCRFDLRDGIAQLFPKGADDKAKALIHRAVAYGEMKALEAVAEDFESGRLVR